MSSENKKEWTTARAVSNVFYHMFQFLLYASLFIGIAQCHIADSCIKSCDKPKVELLSCECK